MTIFFVSRHPGAIEWAAHHGLKVDKQIAHLDPADIRSGDMVIGTLPVNIASEVLTRGGRFFNLSLDMPPEARGMELSADDMERFGARIEEFFVKKSGGQ
ncbi:putative CRISPR-associated protein [Ferrovum myxofaciens]|uniref:Putative CRISPR-associated protein n=1 Tax=Ferrovum myxofaciens TaxID=416213 RepID=A0A149VWN3_9PROT|nr:CRISPR-associated protein Csx16 [Ferrovum myxofaciens]KXW57588.1 putative CRISPR-associated protein [Ferrovum myxofaciens]